jgi:hypothetical protein
MQAQRLGSEFCNRHLLLDANGRLNTGPSGRHDPPSGKTSEAWIDETWAQWNRIAPPMSITIAYSIWVQERARRMARCEWLGIERFSSL